MDIYIHVEEHVTIFSGIKFADFIECTAISIENMLLLKANYVGKKHFRKFELLEGMDDISELLREDIYNYGDFCFVDYISTESVNRLSNEQIAELLYLAHIFEPLKSPFFEVLQNKFAYLSHDNGWYCKLFCKEWQISVSILLNKLQKNIQTAVCNNEYTLPKNLIEIIQKSVMSGLLVSVDLSKKQRKMCTIKLYEVGKYENPDILFNTIKRDKLPTLFEISLIN